MTKRCECGEHNARCMFGRAHTWMLGFIPEAIIQNTGVNPDLAQRGSLFCYTCNAIHVGDN